MIKTFLRVFFCFLRNFFASFHQNGTNRKNYFSYFHMRAFKFFTSVFQPYLTLYGLINFQKEGWGLILTRIWFFKINFLKIHPAKSLNNNSIKKQAVRILLERLCPYFCRKTCGNKACYSLIVVGKTLSKIQIRLIFKSKERSEDSYVGHVDFFCFFFRKKSQNIDALRYNALFEFN